MIKSSCAKWSS